MSTTQNLERSYNLCIEQDNTLTFFRDLSEYADYILKTNILEDTTDKHITERNILCTKIEDGEKKAV